MQTRGRSYLTYTWGRGFLEHVMFELMSEVDQIQLEQLRIIQISTENVFDTLKYYVLLCCGMQYMT